MGFGWSDPFCACFSFPHLFFARGHDWTELLDYICRYVHVRCRRWSVSNLLLLLLFPFILTEFTLVTSATANLKLAASTATFTVWNHFFIWGSIALWFIFGPIYCEILADSVPFAFAFVFVRSISFFF